MEGDYLYYAQGPNYPIVNESLDTPFSSITRDDRAFFQLDLQSYELRVLRGGAVIAVRESDPDRSIVFRSDLLIADFGAG